MHNKLLLNLVIPKKKQDCYTFFFKKGDMLIHEYVNDATLI